MSHFKIVPLPEAYATHIRTTRQDDFGHEVIEQMATGYGPCRVSLQPFTPGEDKRLLLAYSPFALRNAFNQPGPIFISASEVAAYTDVHRFPTAIKNDKKHFPLTFIGYSKDQQMVHTELLGNADADEVIRKIFTGRPDVEYLHARNAEAGCFICKIERV
jgi:hypothetical protein